MKRIHLSYLFMMLSFATVSAQSQEWKLIHKGNRSFNEKQYNAAGAYYSKALKINPDNPRAAYNLGNVRLAQNEQEEAMKLYQNAAEHEKSPLVRSMAYHNRGYIYQQQASASSSPEERQKKLVAAIAEYKQALRENPESEGSRYNLALCQKQLKESPDKKSSQQPQHNPQEEPPKQNEKKQNDPLMNYARQAEKKTREKLNARPRQKALEKNW